MSDYKEQLISIFERVSGCAISEFTEEQIPYLAGMIEGQLDANEQCIESLNGKIKSCFDGWIDAEDANLVEGRVYIIHDKAFDVVIGNCKYKGEHFDEQGEECHAGFTHPADIDGYEWTGLYNVDFVMVQPELPQPPKA